MVRQRRPRLEDRLRRRLDGSLLPGAGSAVWRKWTTRSARSGASYAYLANTHRAARFFLKEYVEPGTRGEKPVPFEAMLKRMHVLTVAGIRSVPHQDYDPQQMHPELFREEVPCAEDGGHRRAVAVEARSAIVRLLVRTIERARKSPRATGALRMPIDFGAGPLEYEIDLTGSCEFSIAVDGIEASLRPRIAIEGDGVRLDLPTDPRRLLGFRQAAEKKLDEVLRLDPAAVSADPASRERLAAELAHYFQLMVVWHPFLTNNNSFVMNQINSVLFAYLSKCLPQGSFDVLAMMWPTPLFKKYFQYKVRNARYASAGCR